MIIVPLPYGDLLAMSAAYAENPGFVLLNGNGGGGHDNRYGYFAAAPVRTIKANGVQAWVDDTPCDEDPFAVLQGEIGNYSFDPGAVPVPFCGGAIGALGYELGGCLEKLPLPKTDFTALPTLRFGIYDTFAAFDHQTRQAWVLGYDQTKVEQFADDLRRAPRELSPLDWSITGQWQAEQSRAEVERHIRTVIDYIYAGDIFQANYTQKFRATRTPGLDDLTLYRRLCALNPAPFAAFMRWADATLASASPERFLRVHDGKIEAWPIKGTRPRDAQDPAHDAALARELTQSAKDQAENLMIVDLMRNDLSRVCIPGSVKVTQLNGLESFASVHHLVSHIEGHVRDGYGPVDILRATFPGGSVTGAPKIRAMEIIHELEPSPRGFYCGGFGWIGFDGAMDMAMTIRTLVMTHDTIMAQAGGGIVADSDPAAEYEESMTKIASLLRAVEGGTP